MANTNSTRRKARKPAFIEVEGHQLTPAFYAGYEHCLEARAAVNPGVDTEEIKRLGLSDFLHSHRPSTKIQQQLLNITKEAVIVSLAIGNMRHYSWSSSDMATIRSAGCELVKNLALELYNASAKLTAIAMNVEAEPKTKLQDWLAQDEQVARIGRGAEVTHG